MRSLLCNLGLLFPMHTIDIHTHILPQQLPDWDKLFGYKGFIRLEHHKPCCARMMLGDTFFREIEHNCWDPEVRIKECNSHHVHQQVLSTIPVLFNYWAKPADALETSMYLNDHLIRIQNAHPTHFYSLATVPLQDPQLACKELERAMLLGMYGVEIGSHINDWNLNDPVFHPFWETCERLGAAVFVHPWDMMGKDKMKQYWLPWLVGMPAETSLAICSMLFGGVFEKFPNLRVAFAHGGGSFPATFGRIQHGFEVRPDLVAVDNPIAPQHYLGKFWLDSLVHDPHILKYIISLIGREKIALGTDYPFPLGELKPGNTIAQAQLDAETQAWLLHKSALNWLGVPQ